MKAIIKNICLISALSSLGFAVYADNAPAAATTTTTTSTTTTAPASTTTGPALTGNYKCQRTEASGTVNPYTLAISSTGSTYTLEWDGANGSPVLYGTGVTHPSATNALSVVFFDIGSSPDSFGNELFLIKPDGSLQGNLLMRTGTTFGTETCTKS